MMAASRAVALLLALVGLALLLNLVSHETSRPIRVGVLHSQSGPMAAIERPVIDATLLAIEELNEKGGILGREVEPVLADGRSTPATFGREAEWLVSAAGVAAIFGCWTSDSRNAVRAVVEQQRHLLFYPAQYEGFGESPHVVFTGAAPNQQVIPAVHFTFLTFGSNFFLVGEDDVFSRASGAIIRDAVELQGGRVVGEEYVPLLGEDFSEAVAAIGRLRPDVILNTLRGDSNRAFFQALRGAGISSQTVPTISLRIDEGDVRAIGLELLAGDFIVWNYFESLETPASRRFVERFRSRFGSDRPTTDAMQAAYTGVWLWAQAVAEAGSDDVALVRDTLANQSFEAPGGVVHLDPETRHIWQRVHVAQVQKDGDLEIVWSSDQAVRPVPFPPSRPREAWERLLAGLLDGADDQRARAGS